jgi:GNAT-like C-terminal domain/N-acyltransferase N-terminal domain
MPDARVVLDDPDLGSRLTRLGLRDDDAEEVLALVPTVLGRAADLAEVDRLAAGLRAGLGVFPGEQDLDRWAGYDPAGDPYGSGVLPLLALVVTAGDLVAFHRSRGVPAEVTEQTLTELGQQVWVHRLTFDELGLHTYGWLPVTWSGSLYWLGRLQFNLERLDGGWVCSTHIPRSGPLDPDAVDRSFRAAADFFPRHFPDRPVQEFWCRSWLLDPTLAQALDPASNMARFQARWRLYGEPMPGDEDAVFFTFARRAAADLTALPRDTSLQRVIVDRLREGGHWSVYDGRLPLGAAGGPA